MVVGHMGWRPIVDLGRAHKVHTIVKGVRNHFEKNKRAQVENIKPLQKTIVPTIGKIRPSEPDRFYFQ